MAGGIKQAGIFTHGGCNACALNGILHAPLFVAVAPQDNRRVIAVALNHVFQQPQVLGIDARKSVFVNDEYALAVADVELRRRHRVVGCTIGIAAQFL